MAALVALFALVLGALAFHRIGKLERELSLLAGEIKRLARAQADPAVARPPAAATAVRSESLAASPIPVTVQNPPAPLPEPQPQLDPAPVRATASVPTKAQATAAPPATPLPTTGRGWEELLGGRILVWLGAVAMALGVAFLVRQFAGHLWLKPEFRLAAGTLLAVALLTVGERLRRTSARVAGGTSAAGIAGLFAVAYAATSTYGLLAPAAGFAFLALVAFAAVLLSLRQGLLVAAIGLIGGMATPALVHSQEPRPVLLFGYLLLLQIAVFAVSRRSSWWPLAIVNGLAGLGWVLAWLAGPYGAGDSLWLGLFLLASTASAVAAAREGLSAAAPEDPDRLVGRNLLIGGGLVASLLASGAVLVKAEFGLQEWGFLFVLSAAALAVAARAPHLRAIAAVVTVLFFGFLAAWSFNGVETSLGLYFGVLAGALVLFAVVPWMLHLRRSGDRLFVVLAAIALVAVPLLAHLATYDLDLPVSRGLVVLVLAAVALGAAVPLARRRTAEGSTVPLGAFAAAVTSLVSLAIPLELGQHWWSVGWALEVPALAWLATRLRLPLLGRLGVLVAAAAVVRLTVNPFAWNYPIGTGAWFNWLLYGYGLSIAALGAATVIARARGSRRQGFSFEAGAALLGFVWLVRGVHQVFHLGHNGRFFFLEWAWITGLGALLGLVLARHGRRRERPETEAVGLCVLAVALCTALVAGANLFSDPVGVVPVLNGLLLAFAVPAAVLGILAFDSATESLGRRLLRTVCGAGALGLTFLWVTLEVRHLFRGTQLGAGSGTNAEGFAYSAAWVLLGTALLVFGLKHDRFALRLCGLAVLALAAAKVFLFDVAGLGDLYRVLSFLGLGASLLGLGYLYQRFVRSSS